MRRPRRADRPDQREDRAPNPARQTGGGSYYHDSPPNRLPKPPRCIIVFAMILRSDTTRRRNTEAPTGVPANPVASWSRRAASLPKGAIGTTENARRALHLCDDEEVLVEFGLNTRRVRPISRRTRMPGCFPRRGHSARLANNEDEEA